MVTINLLPWREGLIAYQRRTVKNKLLGMVLIMIVVMASTHVLLTAQEQKYGVRIAALHAEKQQGPFPSLSVSTYSLKNKLDHRLILEHVLGVLTQINANQICFTQLSSRPSHFTFSGKAPSTLSVTQFLMHWPASAWFSQINIESLHQSIEKEIRFRFSAKEQIE